MQGIKSKKIPISLTVNEPTKITPENLQKQLNSIGLSCPETYPEKLEQSIKDVIEHMPDGKLKSFGIYKPDDKFTKLLLGARYNNTHNLSDMLAISEAEGSWKPSDTALGYMSDLAIIQNEINFDLLLNNYTGFTGKKDTQPTYNAKYDTVDAIKSLFVEVGTNASAAVVSGIDKDNMEAVFSNIIAPLDDTSAKDYDQEDSRLIYLVENYNPATDEADGIGVICIKWHLTIKDYKKKKGNLQHNTTLTVSTRAVVYDDINVLEAQIAYIEAHHKGENALCAIPPKTQTVNIFDTLPAACKDTFVQSLPLISKTDYVDVIVFHSADLENVGCIDNTDSEGEAKYSKSITSGFTFTTSQTISVGYAFEANAIVAKGTIKVSFSISFTEQWSSSQTETIEFAVPAGKKAYLYQGYLKCSTLRLNTADGTYKYVDSARFLTNILKTTEDALV